MTTPIFQVGDRVTAIGFTDCFGRRVQPTTGLTVERVTKLDSPSMATYFRVLARDGFRCVEGAERFFVAE